MASAREKPLPVRSPLQVEERHERFLTPDEFCQLGQAFDAAPVKHLASAQAAAAIRLLLLTGAGATRFWVPVGGPRPPRGRDTVVGQQERTAGSAHAAAVGQPPGRALPCRWNSWVFSGEQEGHGATEHQRLLGQDPEARGLERRATT